MNTPIAATTVGAIVVAATLGIAGPAPASATCRELVPGDASDPVDPVIKRALTIVGQFVNPVNVVSTQEIEQIYACLQAGTPPAGLNAFRTTSDGSDRVIYVNRDSAVYRKAARQASALSLLKLAATLVHEQVHNTDDDHAAYRRQSDFLRSRLSSLPRHERQEARGYLETLEARAVSRGHVERLLRQRRSAR